jgi:hypothetical protein
VIRQAPEAAGDWIAKHISVHAAARMPSSRVGSIYSDFRISDVERLRRS